VKKVLLFVFIFLPIFIKGGHLRDCNYAITIESACKRTTPYSDEIAAPQIYQRLLEHGLQELNANPVDILATKYLPQTWLAVTLFAKIMRGIRVGGTLFIPRPSIQKKIYVSPILTAASYGIKRATILHEIVHTKQPGDGKRCYPINPDQHTNVELEADTEALKHISCWKCAEEFARTRPNKRIEQAMRESVLAKTGVMCEQTMFSETYLEHDAAMLLVHKKRERSTECPYHQELRKIKRRLLNNPISPPASVLEQRYRATARNLSVMFNTEGQCGGFIMKFIILKLIEKGVEDKVASGEIEP